MGVLVNCSRCFKPMLVTQLPAGKTYCTICRSLMGLPDEPASAAAPAPAPAPPAPQAVAEKPAPSFKGRGKPVKARRRRAAEEGSSSTGLVVGLCVGGVVLVLAVAVTLVLVLTEREEPAKNFTRQDWPVTPPAAPQFFPNPPPPNPVPPPPRDPVLPNPFPKVKLPAPPPAPKAADRGLVPDAIPQPAPPHAAIAGRPFVDLISSIDPARDAVHGRWAVFLGALHCNDQHFVPRIQLPYRPPAEYDFIVTFSQPALRNGISLLMPKPGGGSFFWYVGSGNGSEFGFWPRARKSGRSTGLIRPRTAYTTTVQVRRNGVKGLLDGRVLVDYPTDFRDLGSDTWRQMRDPSLLAVACDDPTVFHYVLVVEVTGRGTKTR